MKAAMALNPSANAVSIDRRARFTPSSMAKPARMPEARVTPSNEDTVTPGVAMTTSVVSQ